MTTSFTLLKSINDIFEFSKRYKDNRPLRKILLQLKRLSPMGIFVDIYEDYKDEEINTEMESLDLKNLKNKATKLLLYSSQEKNNELSKKLLLGIVIIRPLYEKVSGERKRLLVSDTISAPPPHLRSDFFITCGIDYEEVINGERHLIKGIFPYFQQHWDDRWECGFAVLRMFSRWASLTKSPFIKEGIKKGLTLPEIDRLSKRKKLTEFSTDDLIKVLNEMGFSVKKRYIFNNPDVDDLPTYEPEQIIYSWIESGIPCFITFQTKTSSSDGEDMGHVIIVIGHTFNCDAWWPEAERAYYSKFFWGKPPILRSTAWIDFVINDDNYGPYCRLPKEFLKVDIEMYKALTLYKKKIRNIESNCSEEEKQKIIGTDQDELRILAQAYPFLDLNLPKEEREKIKKQYEEKIRNSRLWEIIVPIPKDIDLKIDGPTADVITLAVLQSNFLNNLIEKIKNKIDKASKFWLDRLYSHLKSGIVLRSILVSYKDLTNKEKFNINPQLVQFIGKSNKELPEYVWLTEISLPELFSQTQSCIGKMIINPFKDVDFTKEEFLKTLLYIHIPGLERVVNYPRDFDFYPPLIQKNGPSTHFNSTA